MNKFRSYYISALPIVLAATVGCADTSLSDYDDYLNNDDRAISFTAKIMDESSRGEALSLTNLTDFQVSATVETDSASSLYFSNEKYAIGGTASAVQLTESGKVYYWLDDKAYYNFFATAPAGIVDFDEEAVDQFNFVVDTLAQNQVDLMACSVAKATYGQPVALKFQHLLAQININCSGAPTNTKLLKIEMAGIVGEGKYDMTTSAWNLATDSVKSFSLTTSEAITKGTSITGTDGIFFMLPQQLGDSAVMRATWIDAAGDTISSKAQLKGKWQKGVKYNYQITLNYDYSIDVTSAALLQDAPYTIVKNGKVTLNINGPVQSGFTLTASASDSAQISILLEKDLNNYAKTGFWTDKLRTPEGVVIGSARGSNTLTGFSQGANSIAVFLPENAADSTRTINLVLTNQTDTLAQAKILQLPPAWSSGAGWEQIDDGGLYAFGFDWTRIAYWAYRGPESLELNASDLYLQSIIDWFNADDFASIGKYLKHSATGTSQYRAYIKVDYADLTSLSGLSYANGFSNTQTLNSNGGAAATLTLERALESMTLSGKSSLYDAFYIPTEALDGPHAPTSVLTTITGENALAQVLKKNPYDLVQMHPAANGQVGYACILKSLVWYLPAYEQFSYLPTSVVDEIHSSDCWSSTASGAVGAYNGKGQLLHRASLLKVRACRSLSD